MGRRLIASVMVLLLLAGCTTVRPWQPAGGDPATLDTINRYGSKHEARVALRDGSSFVARQLVVTAEDLRWVDASSGEAKQVPLGAVREIDFTLPGRGAAQGAGFGLLAGALIGVIVGQGEGGMPGPTIASIALGILFGLMGGGVGCIAGAGGGAHVVYQVVPAVDRQGADEGPPRVTPAAQPL